MMLLMLPLALAQDVAAVLPDPHPVDPLSAIVGGGGVTGLGVAVIALLALGNKLGLSLPRITIGGGEKPKVVADESSSTIRPAVVEADLTPRIAALETECDKQRSEIRRLGDEQTRTLLEVRELRDLAQQILLRLMER